MSCRNIMVLALSTTSVLATNSVRASNTVVEMMPGTKGPALSVSVGKPATLPDITRWKLAASHGDAKAESRLAGVYLVLNSIN